MSSLGRGWRPHQDRPTQAKETAQLLAKGNWNAAIGRVRGADALVPQNCSLHVHYWPWHSIMGCEKGATIWANGLRLATKSRTR